MQPQVRCIFNSEIIIQKRFSIEYLHIHIFNKSEAWAIEIETNKTKTANMNECSKMIIHCGNFIIDQALWNISDGIWCAVQEQRREEQHQNSGSNVKQQQ